MGVREKVNPGSWQPPSGLLQGVWGEMEALVVQGKELRGDRKASFLLFLILPWSSYNG